MGLGRQERGMDGWMKRAASMMQQIEAIPPSALGKTKLNSCDRKKSCFFFDDGVFPLSSLSGSDRGTGLGALRFCLSFLLVSLSVSLSSFGTCARRSEKGNWKEGRAVLVYHHP